VESLLPERHTLPALRRAAAACVGCPLYLRATRTVFGEGPARAELMLVGEQPGDQEDRAGHPFVGGAGRLLVGLLAELGVAREEVYLTNVVKHFKFVDRGKRRIHGKPGAREVNACLPWLRAELALVRPSRVVCLGATATHALLGPQVRVERDHGEVFATELAPWVMPTYHPAALLRARDEGRERLYVALRGDLGRATRGLLSRH
jgi:DNA polymerase